MASPKRYDRIAFVASAGTEAQAALAQLTELYGNHDAKDSDVVVASGPHVLRGMEFYRHRPIAYSLGNFCGYKNFNTDGVLSRSAILQVSVGRRGRFLGGRIVSVHLSSVNRPSLDPSGAAVLMIRKLGHADFGDRSPQVFADGHFVERA